MDTIEYSKTEITGGFWKQKQKLVRDVTIKSVYDQFYNTGRVDAFKFDWKEGMPNKPHIFWDSDIAKWIESVAYITKIKKSPALEKKADEIISNIIKNQGEDGYFNIYFTVCEPQNRFTNRDAHELYCAGHLIEASIAYADATGKSDFLDAMKKYVDYIDKRFRFCKDTAFTTPGHEEIELALVKLYDYTSCKKYLDLAMFFINERGKKSENISEWARAEYSQSHLPVREQTEAVGHAVRAVYLYCAMADIAKRTGDTGLKKACETLFDDIVNKKMYITGGIGSSAIGEAFTVAYDMPNITAYTETCASLGLALFANRMLCLESNSKYADVIERAIYNGFISSLSLDGKAFFYENPLEIIPYLHTRDTAVKDSHVHFPQMERSEVFACSCCPPNITRFIASIANMLYTTDKDTIYVHQFMQSKTDFVLNGKDIHIEQKTRYPENGKVNITISGGDCKVAVRIPGWFDSYKGETKNGYAYFDVKDGETLSFDFTMRPKFIEARREVVFNCGKYAVQKGPIVYCMECADNGEYLRDVVLDGKSRFKEGKHETLGVSTLSVKAYRRISDENTSLYSEKCGNYKQFTAVLIPYYCFSNREQKGMQVWHLVK